MDFTQTGTFLFHHHLNLINVKHFLKIAGLSLLLIPFMTWELLKAFWTFKTEAVKELWNDYTDTVDTHYRSAFPRKRKKSSYNTQNFL